MGARTTCPQCGVQLDSLTTTCGACGAVITGGAMDSGRMEKVRARLQDGIGPGYALGDMLGRGGMGIVFQARELALDRDVALKVLAFDPVLNPDAYARFEREARLAARLDHPNIVPIFAVGQGNGIAFYTMRMVRGGSVEAILAGGQALAVPRALAILKDVASALDYAHANGVVHRDVKPANVLLGDAGHAMVADFGIARAFAGPGSAGGTATGTGVVGSPAYMSPEQWRGEKVDGRADQYALGVLAFELLTGTRPFSGDSMQELLRMHLQDDAPDIVSVRGDLPTHMADAIRRAMAKHPGERFASAGEFVAALTHADGGPAVTSASRPAGAATFASAATVRTPLPGGRTGKAHTAAGRATHQGSAPAAELPHGSPAASGSASAARERRTLVPWLALLLIAGAGAGVIYKLAPQPDVVAAPPAPVPSAAPPADTSGDGESEVERRLQAQIDEARRIALAAQHRADSIEAASRARDAAAGAASAAPTPVRGQVYVFAIGGGGQIYVDGVNQQVSVPALLTLPVGRHQINVRGATMFVPSDTIVDVSGRDTATVVFRTRAAATAQRPGTPQRATPPQRGGDAAVDWDAAIKLLGFDPRTADLRRLTPEQRARYRRFTQYVDSLRKAGGRRP